MKYITCLLATGLQILVAQTGVSRPTPAGTESSRSKFIQTFMVKLRGGERIVPGHEMILGKFDMLMITRTWFDAVQGNTWKAITSINPKAEIYIQTEGPTLWKEADKSNIQDLKDG